MFTMVAKIWGIICEIRHGKKKGVWNAQWWQSIVTLALRSCNQGAACITQVDTHFSNSVNSYKRVQQRKINTGMRLSYNSILILFVRFNVTWRYNAYRYLRHFDRSVRSLLPTVSPNICNSEKGMIVI